jgi:hypothetical protein
MGINAYSPLKVDLQFGKIFLPHFQINKQSKQETNLKQAERKPLIVLPKRRSAMSTLHYVLYKTIQNILSTIMRASNPIIKCSLCSPLKSAVILENMNSCILQYLPYVLHFGQSSNILRTNLTINVCSWF